MNSYLDTAYDILLLTLIALSFGTSGYFIVCQAIDGIQVNYIYHIASLALMGIILSFVLFYFKSRK